MTYWNKRASSYQKINWVFQNNYLEFLKNTIKPKKNEIILDLGTGTGIIPEYIKDSCKYVVGIDISDEMLKRTKPDNQSAFFIMDVRKLVFPDNFFDKVVARMVFHHVLLNIQKGFDEAYRVLKPNGIFVISEGVPPHPKLKNDYIEIFKYKEKRRTFMPEDIAAYMRKSGFKDIKISQIILKNNSIKNWLDNDKTVSSKNKKIIFNLHKNASDFFKKTYDLKERDNDIFINFTQTIITGKKL